MPDDDITAQLPLAAESPESFLARMVLSENAGIDPDDPQYADVVPGSVWDDMSRAWCLEADRLADRMLTEIPAAALPATAIAPWLDAWADALGLERKVATTASGVVTFTGDDGTDVGSGTQVSTEAPTADADPITFQTTEEGTIVGGSIDLSIEALDEGSAGNVPANTVTILDSPLDTVSVSNALAITGGSDVETDEALQGRVVKKLRGTNGAGNNAYYENIALNYPGVGFVTIQPNTPSIGHVTVMIFDVNGDPAPGSMIDGLQDQLDPDPAGQGDGLAAPGATIIVATAAATAVAVVATIVPEDGYSVTGVGGTQALTADITAAVTRYFTKLGVADDVVHNKVLAAIIDVDGVANVSALTLNGGGGDVVIDSTHTAELTLPLTLS